MPEIGTSGSTSGDGKRRVAAWPKRPRPSSTLPQARRCWISSPSYDRDGVRRKECVRTGAGLAPMPAIHSETKRAYCRWHPWNDLRVDALDSKPGKSHVVWKAREASSPCRRQSVHRMLNLPQKGRQDLVTDLKCSESRP